MFWRLSTIDIQHSGFFKKTPSGGEGGNERAKGFEPIAHATKCPENLNISLCGAPKASPTVPVPVIADPDLRAVLDAWANLPNAVKTGIMAMVRASK